MGGDRARRRDSNVRADDVVNAPDIAGITPGKRNLVQTYEVGDEYVDRDGVCEGKSDSVAGCFLTDRKRDKLINKLLSYVQTAQTNYKAALLELKVEELVKKEEDLHWVLSLALDLAGLHLAAVLGRALKNVQALGAAKLTDLQILEAASGQFSDKSWISRADQLIARVTPARIDAVTKAGMTAAAGGIKKATHVGVNVATETARSVTISYINQLRDTCDVAFDRFVSHVAATTADAELVVVFEGMKPENHSIGAYKASLKDKIDRFRKSGVLGIGRREAPADDYGGKLMRDTRVVYVQDIIGNKSLWYQHQDGKSGSSSGYVGPGDPMFEGLDPNNAKHKAAWSKFGPRDAAAAELDRPVPEEFREIALQHSEARWGATITVDDGHVATLKQHGINIDHIRKRLNGSPLYRSSATAFPPGRTPWDTRAGASQPGAAEPSLPAGSIFAENNK
jgi:hypothetical protein